MNPSRILTFTTDFGRRDSYAGQLHGAALSLDPSIRCVDLTHEIPPGDIAAGAYGLETGFQAFPPGTVHVAVVDPGVGTDRRALLIESGDHTFVGPDNGLLLRALRHGTPQRVTVLDPMRVSGRRPSPTFHGRDLFVPAAARFLATGDAGLLGDPAPDAEWPTIDPLQTLQRAFVSGDRLDTPVIHIDRFGNLALDVYLGEPDQEAAPRSLPPGLRVVAGSLTIGTWTQTYAEIGPTPCLLRNSAGYLEIALDSRSAAEELGLAVGESVVVERVRG